jgi:hypothetical protein
MDIRSIAGISLPNEYIYIFEFSSFDLPTDSSTFDGHGDLARFKARPALDLLDAWKRRAQVDIMFGINVQPNVLCCGDKRRSVGGHFLVKGGEDSKYRVGGTG